MKYGFESNISRNIVVDRNFVQISGGGTHFYRIGYHIFKEKREQTGEVLAFSDEMYVLILVMLSKKTSVKLGATIKTYWK